MTTTIDEELEGGPLTGAEIEALYDTVDAIRFEVDEFRKGLADVLADRTAALPAHVESLFEAVQESCWRFVEEMSSFAENVGN